MYCPNCGKENSGGQRFCRSCGLSLQTLTRVLGEELATSKTEGRPVEVMEGDHQRYKHLLFYSILTLMFGLMIIIFGKKVANEQLVADIGTVISFLGTAAATYAGIALWRQTSSLTLPEKHHELLAEVPATKELPAALPLGEPVSIAEQTTRNFEPLNKEQEPE
jgi:hypothetical protein